MLDVKLVNNSICGECGGDIKNRKYIYCEKCHDELVSENVHLKKEISKLKAKEGRVKC